MNWTANRILKYLPSINSIELNNFLKKKGGGGLKSKINSVIKHSHLVSDCLLDNTKISNNYKILKINRKIITYNRKIISS